MKLSLKASIEAKYNETITSHEKIALSAKLVFLETFLSKIFFIF